MRRRRPKHRSADPLIADLQSALTPDRVRDDGAQRVLTAHDASVFEGGLSGPVCFPTSTEEVQAIMRIAEEQCTDFVPAL